MAPRTLAQLVAGVLSFSALRVSAQTAQGVIKTVAGTQGSFGSSGDTGAATSAMLSSAIGGVAFDATGNYYIADTGNNKVRIVQAGGVQISTFAGTGVAGSTGDGGAPTSALLSAPGGVFAIISGTAAGTVLIGDTANHVIRAVNGGIINTVAGTRGVPGSAGDNGPATSATLNSPTKATYDYASGNYYIVDTVRWLGLFYSLYYISRLHGTCCSPPYRDAIPVVDMTPGCLP